MSKIDIRTLECGVRVVMEKIDYVQSAAFGVWVKAGACDETRENAGVSHFIEHMMFKGTKKRSARQIAEDIDRIGGQMNAFTGKEATCYYVKTTSTNIEKGAEVILDMLNNAVFDKHEMTKERTVIYEEMKMIADQPDDLAHETAAELVFKGSPLGNSIIGSVTSLRSISRNVMTAYKEAEYTCDSIVVSIAGNFDEDRFCDFLEDKFSTLNRTKQPKNDRILPHTPEFKVLVKEIQQSHICLSAKAVSLTDPAYYSYYVLNNIIGGSMSSRLFQNIREEKGLAYSVYSMFSAYSREGSFSIYAGVAHDKIRDAVEGILAELAALAEGEITKDEISMAKEQLKAGYTFGQENTASRMFANGKGLLLSSRVFLPEEVLAGIDAVTEEELCRVKKKIADPAAYSGACVSGKRVDLKKMWKA